MKKLLFLFAGCLLFGFNAKATGSDDMTLWSTSGISVSSYDGAQQCASLEKEASANTWDCRFYPPTWIAPGNGNDETFEFSFDVKYIGNGTDGDQTGLITFIQGRQFESYPGDDAAIAVLCDRLGIEEVTASDRWRIARLIEQLIVSDFTDTPDDFEEGALFRNVFFYPTNEWQHFSFSGTLGRHAADSIDIAMEFGSMAGEYLIKNVVFTVNNNEFASYFVNPNDNPLLQDWTVLGVTDASVNDENTVTITKAATSDSWNSQLNPPTWIAPSKGKEESYEFSFDAKYEGDGTDGDETGRITFIQGRQFGSFFATDDETAALCESLGIDIVPGGSGWLIQSNVEQMYVDNYTDAPEDFYEGKLLRNVNFYPTADWQHFYFSGYLGRHAADSVDLSMEFGSMAGSYSIRNVKFTVKGKEFASYFKNEIADDNFEYEQLGDNTLAVAKFINDEATSVTIPSTVTKGETEYTVVAINDEVFKNATNLTSITIPNTVASIGNKAFASCSSLESINIPASVETIGSDLFDGCSNMTAITVDNNNYYWSAADGVLFNKNQTVLKYCPAGKTGKYTVPSTVTEIATNAFHNCSDIEEVILPTGLQTIDERAFWYCQGMSSIIIPESVTWIAEDAFRSCDYTLTIYCEATVEQDWDYNWNSGCDVIWAYGAWSLSEDGVLTVKKNIVFYSKSDYPWNSVRDDITSVVIENGVTTIGAEAFRDCYNLETVTLPNTITAVYEKAFNGCSSLKSNDNSLFSITALYLGNEDNPFLCLIKSKNDDWTITVHSDCKVIANQAFSSSYVSTITVPETVEYIGEGAFSSVNTVYYTGSATGSPWGATVVNPVEDGDFVYADEEHTILVEYKGSDTEIEIPSTVVAIGEGVFSYRDITSVVFPDGLKKIGEDAFYYCKKLTSVELPESLTTIDDGAFAQCDALATAEIPSSVVYIGDNAFENCALTSVTIPSSVEYIGEEAFSSCDNLETIDFSNATSLEEIGERAFRWCYQLKTVDMTNATSLENIGAYAFYECSNLEKVIIPTIEYAGEYLFVGCSDDLIIFSDASYEDANSWDYNWNRDYNDNWIRTVMLYKNLRVDVYSNNGTYGTVTGSGDYEYGTEVTITATANSGYTFVRWSDGNTSSTRKIIVRTWGQMYQAIFADESDDIYTVALSVNNENYGSVYGAGNYVDGENVELYAIPAEGCYFVKWSDNSTSSDRYFSYISEDISLTAEFAINTYNVTLSATNGTIEGASNGTYDYGTELTLNAVPDEGYKFYKWDYDYGTNSNPLNIFVDGDMGIEAIFVEASVEVFEGTNQVYASGRELDNCYFTPDETTTYTISCNNSNAYLYVLDADKNILTEAGAIWPNGPRIVIELTEGETYYIGAGYRDSGIYGQLFVFINKPVTINVSAENGTVTGGGTYNYNSNVYLYAKPAEGYKFVRWSDGETDWDRELKANADMDLEAIFAEEDQNIFYIDAWSTVDGYYPSGGYVMGESSYAEGETVTLTAVPNVGNKFSQWRDGNTDNPRTITVTENAEYVAELVPIQYTITKVAENGTINGGNAYYTYGQWAELTAVPNDYCTFTGWSDTESTSTYRRIKITSDTTITAYFEAQLFDVTATAENPAQGSVKGSGSYAYGAQVELEATGATGYHFLKWNDENADNPRTITVSANESNNIYTAIFEINTYNVSVDPQLENGTITGIKAGGVYTHGEEATFKAEGIGSYNFVRWSDLKTDEEITVTVTNDMVLSAVFSDKTIYEVTTSATHGSVRGASNYFEGEKATFTASADEGYHFTYWNDDRDATEPTLKKTITKDQTITAHFAINVYNVAIAAGAHGSVVAKKEGKDFANGEVEHGEEIVLKATADAGYHFAGWSDGNSDAERTISVTKDMNLTANFEIDTYTLSVKATNGTIEGNGTFAVGTEVTLTAKPADGYRFVKWSDGNTDNPRKVTITAELFNTIDESFTAVFEAGEVTAIAEEEAVAEEVNIYAYGNTIVVENATSAIDVYSAMGQLVSRTIANGERNVITVNGTGIYIVRTGNVAKRVMLQ